MILILLEEFWEIKVLATSCPELLVMAAKKWCHSNRCDTVGRIVKAGQRWHILSCNKQLNLNSSSICLVFICFSFPLSQLWQNEQCGCAKFHQYGKSGKDATRSFLAKIERQQSTQDWRCWRIPGAVKAGYTKIIQAAWKPTLHLPLPTRGLLSIKYSSGLNLVVSEGIITSYLCFCFWVLHGDYHPLCVHNMCDYVFTIVEHICHIPST